MTRKLAMTDSAPSQDRRFAWCLAAILGLGLAARLAFIFVYYDLDWEPDGYQHVIIAKAVFAHLPDSLWLGIGVWAKPLYTYFFGALYRMLPSAWPAVVITQAVNAVLWTVSAGITVRLAQAFFRHRATVVLIAVIAAFTFVSFRASVTANTEPVGALVFSLALWAWHRRRILPALMLFGLVICVRTDGVFCVAAFALAAMGAPLLAREKSGWRTALIRGAAFALPLALWDLAGFLQTGSPLFVLSHGYPPVIGKYGSGGLFHFVIEFARFDSVMFFGFLAGAGLVLGGREPVAGRATLRPALAAALLYFLAMSGLWWFGAFGSAGLLRYFVFCYPIYILLAGVAVDAGLSALPPGRWPRRAVGLAGLLGAGADALAVPRTGHSSWRADQGAAVAGPRSAQA